MVIDEWLHRLNLLHLKKFFEKAKIRRVSQLIFIGDASELEITDKLELRRLNNMLRGDIETKDLFKYLTKHGVRALTNPFVANQ